MGSLQPGIPLPSLLPKGWFIIVTDLKECFFTIPLQELDRGKTCLHSAYCTNSQPVKRYQWKVLPQSMLNSPTFWQYFIQQSLEIIWKLFPQSIISH